MNKELHGLSLKERLLELPKSSKDSLMGKLLRKFWQPIALSAKLETGKPRAVRILGEDLTLYRGESGRPYLVGGRCAHRMTALHTGWIRGEEIRCIYHGWQYNGTGQCTLRPAEDDARPTNTKIEGYAVREYCGLIFAYLGEDPVPDFDLPRKDALDAPGRLIFAREQVWPCNWFQVVENSLDAVHVSFVHQAGKVGAFGEAVTEAIPKLEYLETDAGIRQIATRAKNNVRISDWTFPNNNHIVLPPINKGAKWFDLSLWNVAIDDGHVARFQIYAIPSAGEEEDDTVREHFTKHGQYNPVHHHDELFHERVYPVEEILELTPAQDYLAVMGQGTVVDRPNERLGKSDLGIVLLRRLFWREMQAIQDGESTKRWRKLDSLGELPVQGKDAVAAQ
jgi:5,5'-dehydrodivanillate O-demethylase